LERLGYPAAGWVIAATYLQYAWTHLRRVPRASARRLASGPFWAAWGKRVPQRPANQCRFRIADCEGDV